MGRIVRIHRICTPKKALARGACPKGQHEGRPWRKDARFEARLGPSSHDGGHMTPIRVLVGDDHDLVREGIKAVLALSSDIQVVAEAGDGLAAISAFEAHQPDVAVLDVRMPGCDGATATEQIRQRHPSAKIIALSHHDGDQAIQRCLDAGAATYVFKRTAATALANTIRAVASGTCTLPEDVAATLKKHAGQPVLSERERQVLGLLAKGNGNKEVARLLSLSVNTINSHVATIMVKLRAADRTEAVTLALQRGFLHLD